MKLLKWTSELPTEPGLYFHRAWLGSPIELLQIARIDYATHGHTSLAVVYPIPSKTPMEYVERMGGEWASAKGKDNA